MIDLNPNPESPGLLVSVRNSTEALAALAAGADVIDVKEPDRGALGAADATTISAIVRAVNGRVPVTAALGEVSELISASGSRKLPIVPRGVSLFKIGLAGCGRNSLWRFHWRDVIAAIHGSAIGAAAQPVAVVYADWHAARAPQPDAVLQAAFELHSPALLIDTWDKSTGNLFDHWPADELRPFLDRVRARNLLTVLAGSLNGSAFDVAVRMNPHFVAVRTAACDAGRNGKVSTDRVRKLKQTIAAHRNADPNGRLIGQR